jgi:hypothetical protein
MRERGRPYFCHSGSARRISPSLLSLVLGAVRAAITPGLLLSLSRKLSPLMLTMIECGGSDRASLRRARRRPAKALSRMLTLRFEVKDHRIRCMSRFRVLEPICYKRGTSTL